MNKLLTQNDIYRVAHSYYPLLTHRSLSRLQSITQLFKFGAVLLLYETRDRIGHWTCVIFHRKRKTIEFFDSYGLRPNEQKEYMPKSMWQSAYLSKLLFRFKIRHPDWTIEYNELPLQSWDSRIATCGRWVGVRLYYRETPLTRFQNFFSSHRNKDLLITRISQKLLNKK